MASELDPLHPDSGVVTLQGIASPDQLNPTLALGVTPHLLQPQGLFGSLPPPRGLCEREFVDLGKHPIRLGTSTAGSFRDLSERLNPRRDTWQQMQKAFNDLQAALNDVHPDVEVQALDVDIDYGMVTLIISDDPNEDIKMTLGEVKAALTTHPKLADKPNPAAAAEHFVSSCFTAFTFACTKSGVKTYQFYSPFGPDRLGSEMGKEPLKIDKKTPKIIQDKQAVCLTQAQQKTKCSIKTFVTHCFKDSQNPNKYECQAMTRVIEAEALLIGLRKRLTQHVQGLKENPQVNAKAIEHANTLLRQLKETNRHAFWTTAIFINNPDMILAFEYERKSKQKDVGTFEEFSASPEAQEILAKPQNLCFEMVLRDHYEDVYAEVDEDSKPSFESFCNSIESSPFKRHAAEVASLMIHDPKEYRLFCMGNHLEPNRYNPNAFLCHVLSKPETIDFSHFGMGLEDQEAQDLQDEVTQARDDSEILTRQARNMARLVPSTGSPPTGAEMLRKAIKDDVIWSQHLQDTTFKPTWGEKAHSWFSFSDAVRLSPFAAGG